MSPVHRLRDARWLADLLGVQLGTISSWVSRRRIPHFKFGRVLRFDEDEIAGWIEARRVRAGEEPRLRAVAGALR